MFPNLIDAVLHLVAIILSYLFFGEFAAKTYIGFAVLNMLILWILYGDYVECFKNVPIWLWNLTTNLVLLLVITPVLISVAKKNKEVLSDRILEADHVLLQPPKFDGMYVLEKVCETGCSKERFAENIDKIEKMRDVYDAYLGTLWWDTLPFSWGFFLISLVVSIYISLKNKN